jgi:hypothetical protein
VECDFSFINRIHSIALPVTTYRLKDSFVY